MFTLVLKIRMNSDECVEDKGEIGRALRVLVGYTHVDISDDELEALMKQALSSCSLPQDVDYEIVED